jgi:hypothetical protein
MPTSAPHGYRSAQQFLRGEGASLIEVPVSSAPAKTEVPA